MLKPNTYPILMGISSSGYLNSKYSKFIPINGMFEVLGKANIEY
jgi:hypothetical protein